MRLETFLRWVSEEYEVFENLLGFAQNSDITSDTIFFPEGLYYLFKPKFKYL